MDKTFDWNIAISRANGNQDLARELSGLLLETIKEALPELTSAWSQQDIQHLTRISHKLHGGAAYTGALKVQNSSKTFEKQLLSGEVSQKSYENMLESLQEFSVFFESSDA